MSQIQLIKQNKYQYDILHKDTHIGFIQLSPDSNRLMKIDIYEEYRGQGYGTEAIGNLIEEFKEQGKEEITTSTVISPALEHILLTKFNFERNTEKPSHMRLSLADKETQTKQTSRDSVKSNADTNVP